jgi:peptidoglycan LD-endopeptidase LytH
MRQVAMKKIFGLISILVIVIGFIIPQRFVTPVEGADKNSYNSKSFWYFPWGKSGTHKGVDIFAKEGIPVKSSTGGLVLYAGEMNVGGNAVIVLGPKWRLHYYAHLKEIDADVLSWTSRNEKIGSVGTTGNAKGKSPHLHYSIITMIPYPWRVDSDKQGWKKMFYLNPIDYLNERK